LFKIALGQIEVRPGHPDWNTAAMLRQIERAKKQGVELIIFPEMAVPGYLLGDTWEQPAFLRDCEYHGELLRNASKGIAVMFGNVGVDWQKKNNDGRTRKYNAFFTAYDGEFLWPVNFPYPFQIKTLQPNYREFDDTRHFFSLQKLAREQDMPLEALLKPIRLPLSGQTISVGCILCEDGWSDDYAIAPLEILHKNHAVDLFVNISSSPYTLGKNEKRNRVFGAQAKKLRTPLLYVNAVGVQNNGKTLYTFDGSSTAYNAQGQIIACAKPYEETLLRFSLALTDDANPPLDVPPRSDIAAIYDALRYGVEKFLRDIHMEKVVIGVSGGIDSAVAAALYTSVLGANQILLVNMPSKFNSKTTKDLSRQLAENLGCHYAVAPIQEVVEYSIRQFEETPIVSFGGCGVQNLTVSSFVAENIQARDRSARVLAGMAAAFGGGFTCNANKAETTVGYSTLYGDQSGFLAALGDLWKFQIYALAAYMNKEIFCREVIPQATIDLVPSAELSANQNVDEGKGDPLQYPYHDYLFRAFIERWERAAPEDILEWYAKGCLEERLGCEKGLVKKYFASTAEFIADVERWWNLYTGMAVAKRIQAPPVLAVSRRAYGFDHREAQNGPYYTARYRKLKAELLQK